MTRHCGCPQIGVSLRTDIPWPFAAGLRQLLRNFVPVTKGFGQAVRRKNRHADLVKHEFHLPPAAASYCPIGIPRGENLSAASTMGSTKRLAKIFPCSHELSRSGNGGNLLRGGLPGAEDETPHPLRETVDRLPTILRHSTVRNLCPGRPNQERPRPNQPQSTRNATSESTTGAAAWLGRAQNMRKLLW